MKWKEELFISAAKRLIIITVFTAAILVFTLPWVMAQQSYMGGYFYSNVVTTNRVIVSANFEETNAGQIPSNK